ncbi:GlyGly-CTERM sorting domain-containing protein, partial [Veronia pacifica]
NDNGNDKKDNDLFSSTGGSIGFVSLLGLLGLVGRRVRK